MSSPTASKTQASQSALWAPRASITLSAVATGLALHAAMITSPHWAIGQTYHLASSSTFKVDLTAGLWGYCRSATFESESAHRDIEEDCYWFHSSQETHPLSVCEAYSRGFVYGTDDVRGIRLPVDGVHDVHRIERPPTSLDDVHIQQFIEKSCSVDGTATIMLSITSMCLAFLTLCAFAWTLVKDEPTPTRSFELQANSTMMQCASMATIASVVLWLHQSWELRQADDAGVHVSIHIGHAVYTQLLVALLYCYGALGMLVQDGKSIHPTPTVTLTALSSK